MMLAVEHQTPGAASESPPIIVPIRLGEGTLSHYGRELGLDEDAALNALASALSCSAASELPGAQIIAGPGRRLAIAGCFDEAAVSRVAAQSQAVDDACSRLRFCSYAHAQDMAEALAARLLEDIGRDTLDECRFVAMPRGGFFVLGMLAYLLGLRPEQLEGDIVPNVPLVVVDDICLSGHRFASWLQQVPATQVTFAHLVSHPDLRAALLEGEPKLQACLAAFDLPDLGPDVLGDDYPAWQASQMASHPPPRYWMGMVPFWCFAWSEPNYYGHNAQTGQRERGWRVLPPDVCLKNRRPGSASLPVQRPMMPQGAWRPADDVVWAEWDGEVLIGRATEGQSVRLPGLSGAIWRALLESGDPAAAARWMLDAGATGGLPEEALRREIGALVLPLLARRLLVKV